MATAKCIQSEIEVFATIGNQVTVVVSTGLDRDTYNLSVAEAQVMLEELQSAIETAENE